VSSVSFALSCHPGAPRSAADRRARIWAANDITTAAYSAKLDPSRFITVGLNDVRIGDDVIASVRLADVLAELAKLKPSSAPYRGTPRGLASVNGKPSDKITMADPSQGITICSGSVSRRRNVPQSKMSASLGRNPTSICPQSAQVVRAWRRAEMDRPRRFSVAATGPLCPQQFPSLHAKIRTF
jgi:indolepyruvate decarboxylase